MTKTHNCTELEELRSATGFKIEVVKTAPESDAQEAWYLRYQSLSTIDEVRFGEADEIGESMSEYELAIRYCPFCGLRLA